MWTDEIDLDANFRVVIVCGSSDLCGCVDWMLQLLVVEPGVDGRMWTRSEAKERPLASRRRLWRRVPAVDVVGAAVGQQQLVLVEAARVGVDETLERRLESRRSSDACPSIECGREEAMARSNSS